MVVHSLKSMFHKRNVADFKIQIDYRNQRDVNLIKMRMNVKSYIENTCKNNRYKFSKCGKKYNFISKKSIGLQMKSFHIETHHNDIA